MSATTNLNIQLINSSDYVSVDPINDAFETLDALGLDYVVEQGTSGDWSYRKFKSGTAECWAKITQAATTATGKINFKPAWPFTFAAEPVATVSGGVSGRNDAYVTYVGTSTTGLDAYVNKSTASSLSVWVTVHAIGRVS